MIENSVKPPAITIEPTDVCAQDFIRTVAPPPDWLQKAWTRAKRAGLDTMALDEINAEISASRREKKSGHDPLLTR